MDLPQILINSTTCLLHEPLCLQFDLKKIIIHLIYFFKLLLYDLPSIPNKKNKFNVTYFKTIHFDQKLIYEPKLKQIYL